MTTPMNPAPVDYDRRLMLTTEHYRPANFGTVAKPDACALIRLRPVEGADLLAEIDEPEPLHYDRPAVLFALPEDS